MSHRVRRSSVRASLLSRAFNGRYWVFAGSLTNVEFTLTVTDTSTGGSRSYRSAAGEQATIADTSAF